MSYSHLDNDFMEAASSQLSALRERLQSIEEQISELEEERKVIRGDVYAIERLLKLPADESSSSSSQGNSVGMDAPHLPPRLQGDADAADIAVEVLSERNREPMHYQALADEVVQRGGNLPIGSPGATLNGIMNRDERFVRPFRRGYYALVSDYPNVKNGVGTRRKKRRGK